MKMRNVIIAVLSVALLLVSVSFYFYAKAQRKELRGQSEFYIAVHDALYRSAEIGNTQAVEKIRSTLGSVLWGETRQYKLRFGGATGSNTFTKHFASAESIASGIQMVPLGSLTNTLGTNVTITIKSANQ